MAARFGKSFRVQSPVGPVYRVDGAKVRRKHTDFIGGGHALVYSFVPREEVWVEKMAAGVSEERYLLAHEMVEIALMRILGWKYQRAHDTANRAERRLRKGDNPLRVFTAVLRRHMPGRYQMDVDRCAAAFTKAYTRYK